MVAIEVKYLGPTEKHWIRYKAYTGNGQAVTLDQDDGMNPDANEDRAAAALIRQMVTTGSWSKNQYVKGVTKAGVVYVPIINPRHQGSYTNVFDPHDSKHDGGY